MASKTLIIILAMALIAVTFAASFADEELEVEDLQQYFQEQQMEKRGSKVGSKFTFISQVFQPR